MGMEIVFSKLWVWGQLSQVRLGMGTKDVPVQLSTAKPKDITSRSVRSGLQMENHRSHNSRRVSFVLR